MSYTHFALSPPFVDLLSMAIASRIYVERLSDDHQWANQSLVSTAMKQSFFRKYQINARQALWTQCQRPSKLLSMTMLYSPQLQPMDEEADTERQYSATCHQHWTL
jgi:hypothetical protein